LPTPNTFPYTTLFRSHRSLEGAHLPEPRVCRQQTGLLLLLLAEESVHLLFGPVLCADLPAALLDLAGLDLECLLVPRRRNRNSRSEEHTSELQSPDHL